MSRELADATVDPSRLRLLYELACAFAERLDLDDLVGLVVEKCQATLEAEGASVLLHDRTSEELYFPFVVARDAEVAARLARLRFPAEQGIAGTVLRSGKTVRVDDATSDPRLFRGADEQTGTTTRSLLCAPLVTREGTIGVLQVVNHRGGTPFPPEDEPFLMALAGSVAVAIDNARMYATLRHSEERLKVQVGALRRDLARQDRFTQIVGTSPAMASVFELMESAAAAPITVLIEGETGTGKELVAQGIHKASNRAEHPFVAVNCAALPETLLESELFGHRRGAFTGATHDRVGLFEAARGGTIFLDEVGEMPAVMQAKLLRVLQEGEIVAVGDNRPRKIDVRVISATNRNLAREVEQRSFREDLFYRLSTFPIHLPPLRERREDIGPIAARMVESVARRYEKVLSGIDAAALALLERYDWPGNVRELQNEIERAAALARAGEPIAAAQLSAKLTGARTASPAGASAPAPGGTAAAPGVAPVSGAAESHGGSASTASTAMGDPRGASGSELGTLRDARSSFEADFIRRTLAAQDGNITRAARAMGLSRVALQKKMKDYGLR